MLDDFSRAARQRTILILILFGLVLVLAWASLSVGPIQLSPRGVLAGLLGGGDESAVVVREIRLPRMLLAALVGGALGLCGAAAQSLTRNPLADPAIFGAPQAAALGAVCMLYFGYSEASSPRLLIAAVSGAALSIGLVLFLVRRQFSIISVLLAGLAVGSLSSAGVAIALSLSPNPFAMAEIVFWLMGSFTDRSMIHVWLSLPFLLTGCAIVLRCGSAYRALSLGDDTAVSMGFSPGRAALYTAVALSLAIGGATAVSGAIGFVGLMAPHLVRPFCNGDPKAILVPSMLSGAVLTLCADILVRLIPSTNEIPVGVVTAVLGAPFFLYLVTSRNVMFGSARQ
ncbi:MAG: iron ABC transporter permease [Beijerinckiaceae bacterium]|nr:iron ABC transporter permease [Beijerinckiaceae bacterium]